MLNYLIPSNFPFLKRETDLDVFDHFAAVGETLGLLLTTVKTVIVSGQWFGHVCWVLNKCSEG